MKRVFAAAAGVGRRLVARHVEVRQCPRDHVDEDPDSRSFEQRRPPDLLRRKGRRWLHVKLADTRTGSPERAEMAKSEVQSVTFRPPIKKCRVTGFTYVYTRTF